MTTLHNSLPKSKSKPDATPMKVMAVVRCITLLSVYVISLLDLLIVQQTNALNNPSHRIMNKTLLGNYHGYENLFEPLPFQPKWPPGSYIHHCEPCHQNFLPWHHHHFQVFQEEGMIMTTARNISYYESHQKEENEDWIMPLSPYLGEDVDIYIIDFGFDTLHPEFNGRALQVYDPFNVSYSCYDHGTPVASAAAGLVSGYAKASKLYSFVVGPCTEPSSNHPDILHGMFYPVVKPADMIRAIQFAIQYQSELRIAEAKRTGKSIPSTPPRKTVMNLSIGLRNIYIPSIFDRVFEKLLSNDRTIVVTAAGNGDHDAHFCWPGNDLRIFNVGAYDRYGQKASFSNYGQAVDVYGPGEDVLLAQVNTRWGYQRLSGTSFAAPYVTGWIAAYWSLHPHLTPEQATNAARQYFPWFSSY